jgi:hypothetical protein
MRPPSIVIRPPSLVIIVSSILLILRAAAPLAAGSRTDPFAFLGPAIHFTEEERRRLDQREVVLRILPASGHELAVLAAGSLEVGADALVASVKDMPGLKRGAYVPQIGVFSSPPRLNDLRELTLDAADLKAIGNCQPQHADDCDLKLEPDEIARLQTAARTAPSNNAALEEEFRRVLVDRAAEYLRRGDQQGQQEFVTLLQHSPYVKRMPQLATYLEQYPTAGLAGSESFLYWSKETYAWKPMITITHVTILHGGDEASPEVIVASRDLFSSRYTSGSLILTLLLHNPDVPSQRYLVYINRTWVDGVRALWRPFVEYRVRGQARKVFAGARDRIERTGLALLLRK